MRRNAWSAATRLALGIGVLTAGTGMGWAQQVPAVKIEPAKMEKLGTVDLLFLSYNVEMVEVTGGRFWRPYKSAAPKIDAPPQPNQEVGGASSLYQYRSPIDLSNERLRKLASALGPAYVRVSGTWQNSTYFQDDDKPVMKEAPAGFKSVLTRAEWKGVVDYARAVDAKIVTSMSISAGTRGPDGVWTPAQAKAWLDFTKSAGGNIAAAEFMNEPTFPGPGNAPKGYDAPTFAKDVDAFRTFLRKESPNTVFLGPGGVMEGLSLLPAGGGMKLLGSEDLLKATGPAFDGFSYHFYGSISRRCKGKTAIGEALSAGWLDRTETVENFYAQLRDKYLPGKQMWLTETAEAACGGDEFAGQFADSFRFVNQLGKLAQKGVQAVMHNTLASSDYGLLNEDGYAPRPNYWSAVLWKRLMGPVVLQPGTQANADVRIFAQCTPEGKGGVTVLAMNTSSDREQTISIPIAGEQYTLNASGLSSTEVLLNGKLLAAGPDGSLPALAGKHAVPGIVSLPVESITFIALPGARNKRCR